MKCRGLVSGDGHLYRYRLYGNIFLYTETTRPQKGPDRLLSWGRDVIFNKKIKYIVCFHSQPHWYLVKDEKGNLSIITKDNFKYLIHSEQFNSKMMDIIL